MATTSSQLLIGLGPHALANSEVQTARLRLDSVLAAFSNRFLKSVLREWCYPPSSCEQPALVQVRSQGVFRCARICAFGGQQILWDYLEPELWRMRLGFPTRLR
jgi:hypothetical protein